MKPLKFRRIAVMLAAVFIVSGASGQKSDFHWQQLNEASNRLKGKLTGTVYTLNAKSNLNYFLQDEWVDGEIMLIDGDNFEGLRLRYNAFDDELVVYNNNLRNLFVADKKKVKSFTVKTPEGEQKYVKYVVDETVNDSRYFEMIHAGKQQLLAFHKVVEEQITPYTDKYGILKDIRFKRSISYFTFSAQTGFQKLIPRRSSLLKLFPEQKREVRRFLRKNRLAVYKEKDMIQAFILLDEAGFFD